MVNMWASAYQLEATERLRQYDPAAGIAVQTDGRAWDYSFEEAVRMAIDIYIRLEEYAQAKQKPVWGETWQTVLPGSGLPEELAPKTTAHPEKTSSMCASFRELPKPSWQNGGNIPVRTIIKR